jgi:hypothetical protein
MMRPRTFLVVLFLAFTIASASASEEDVRGEIFVSTIGGALSFQLSLARVYVLSPADVRGMLNQNKEKVRAFLTESQVRHIKEYNEKVFDYDMRVRKFNEDVAACEYEIARIERELETIRSILGERAQSVEEQKLETKLTSELHRETKRLEALTDAAAQISASRPTFMQKRHSFDGILEMMLEPPHGRDFITRSDAEGKFHLKVDLSKELYILIVQKEARGGRWFLRLDKMARDSGKYLFTDENQVMVPDKAQALEALEYKDSYIFKLVQSALEVRINMESQSAPSAAVGRDPVVKQEQVTVVPLPTAPKGDALPIISPRIDFSESQDFRTWAFEGGSVPLAPRVPPDRERVAQRHARPAFLRDDQLGTQNIGPVGYNARWDEYGAYLQKLIEKVQIQWEREIVHSSARPPSGAAVRVTFIIDDQGNITGVTPDDGGAPPQFKRGCVSAVTAGAPYGKWSDDMVAALGRKQKMSLAFYYTP